MVQFFCLVIIIIKLRGSIPVDVELLTPFCRLAESV